MIGSEEKTVIQGEFRSRMLEGIGCRCDRGSRKSGRVTGREWVRCGMSTGAGNTDYLLDNADPRAERRFDALGQLFDARTIEYLAAIGVARGWSCWEVGAGGGSIAEWLAGARSLLVSHQQGRIE